MLVDHVRERIFRPNICPHDANAKTPKRQKILLLGGLSALVLLLVLRAFNIYGEILPWQAGETLIESLKSFVNYTKYPPSLDYLLLTLGIAWLLLSALENVDNQVSKVVERFGSAPMFFDIVHLYLLLIIYRILSAQFGANQGDVNDVWQVWAIAALLALVLYYPTVVFSRFKKTLNHALGEVPVANAVSCVMML